MRFLQKPQDGPRGIAFEKTLAELPLLFRVRKVFWSSEQIPDEKTFMNAKCCPKSNWEEIPLKFFLTAFENEAQCCFGLFLQASGHGTLLVSDGMIICVYMFCMCVPAVCVPLCHLYPAGFSSSAWQQWPASSAGRGWRATHPGWSCYPTHNHPPAKHTHTHTNARVHTHRHTKINL